jgi:peptide/nickel transport system permease protein
MSSPSRQPELEPRTELSTDAVADLVAAEHGSIEGRSPWLLAWRRLRRNYVALAFFGVFLLVCVLCGLAPVFAHDVAHTGPNDVHLGGSIVENGKKIPIVSQGGITFVNGQAVLHPAGAPIGPQWLSAGGRYILGADTLGRDVLVRVLYGGINSLKVGVGSALICTVVAVVLALLAGYYGGWIDWAISRFFDLIWAFPVILLGVALGTALSINGLHWGPIAVHGGSLWIPTIVISYVLIPYVGRPLRGQILSMREKEFVEAATAQGAGAFRIMFLEVLPNVASTVLVFFTLIVANNILIEAALSFLGAGVQPPNPSWGNLIAEGQDRIQTAPWEALVPGIAIVITAVAMNIFGDGLRDALDPRAKVRIGG